MNINIIETSKQPLLSICITSYNRLNELLRCLKSIDTIYLTQIEIVVSEDHSEQREEIQNMVDCFKIDSPYVINFNTNEFNLGYDGNLAKLISLAKGEYVFFISDDDCFIEHSLDKTIEFIQNHECNVAFGSVYRNKEEKVERKYATSIRLGKGIVSVKRYFYDSVLFSGLIFKRRLVCEYSVEKFRNTNYFQIYLFMSVLYKYDGYYMDIPTICTMSDGENAFGLSESSEKNIFLAERESIYSMLEFHKGLIRIMKLFDEENMTDVLRSFEKEYSLRTYQGLSTAYRAGKNEFQIYWRKLNTLDIQLTTIVKIYYWSLKIFRSEICDVVYNIPKILLFKFRFNYTEVKGRGLM